MKRLFRIIRFVLLGLVGGLALVLVSGYVYYKNTSGKHLALLGEASKTITVDGIDFPDLNKNGKLDVYEDHRNTVDQRVSDLLSQMSLEEKAGTMFVAIGGIGKEGELLEVPDLLDPFSMFATQNSKLIASKNITHINLGTDTEAANIARWTRKAQALANRTRLGIPLTIATDPRHAFGTNPLAGFQTKGFSKWPEPLGLAALRDTLLIERFAAIAREEYKAVGIHLALHPMADLATEPRWSRISGTFGEDAQLSAQMVRHYIKGFQGDSLSSESVACMTKHFSGGGPQLDGLDPHFEFGKAQTYPGNNFDYHVEPFIAAIASNTAFIMPYYGIPVGQSYEAIGFSFNKPIITGILRNQLKYNGVICTDWGVLTDKKLFGFTIFQSTGWGVEHLTPAERIVKALDAGVDQFGGEEIPETIVTLVKDGKLSEGRIDASVRRILRTKFQLGLFDHLSKDRSTPKTSAIASPEAMELGKTTQGRAMVLLENKNNILPLKSGYKLYVENISEELANQYGTVVTNPEEADFAILRLETPYEAVGNQTAAKLFHHGDLDFKGGAKKSILEVLEKVPSVVDIYLDRPAVIPEIAEKCNALIANFGASDDVLLKVVFGEIAPEGKLPIEMPSSMEQVKTQYADVPYDSKEPLYPFGYGLKYLGKKANP